MTLKKSIIKITKNILLSSILLSSTAMLAQKGNGDKRPQTPDTPAKTLSIQKKLIKIDNIQTTLKEYLHFGPEDDLRLLHNINSPMGRHYTFIHLYKGHQVSESLIKINTDTLGNPTSIYSNYQTVDASPENLKKAQSRSTQSIPQRGKKASETILESKYMWKKINDQHQFISAYTMTDTLGNYYQEIYNTAGQRIEHTDLRLYYAPKDTLVSGMIYAPDPLTSSGTIYGDKFTDRNDIRSEELDQERVKISFMASYESGIFTLENKYLKIVDNSFPTIAPAQSKIPFFIITDHNLVLRK